MTLRLGLGLRLELRLRWHGARRFTGYWCGSLRLWLTRLGRFAILLWFAMNISPLLVLNGNWRWNFAHCRRRLAIAFVSCGWSRHCRLRAVIGAWRTPHWLAGWRIFGIRGTACVIRIPPEFS